MQKKGKFLALTLVLVLMTGSMVMASSCCERPLSTEFSISGVGLSGDYLGAYSETGYVGGISGRLTVNDIVTFRGILSQGPTRTSSYPWVTFDQTDTVTEFITYWPEISLFDSQETELELRPLGLVLGRKTVATKITEEWSGQQHMERRSQGFSGLGAEIGFEKGHFNSYLGVQKVWHESCGNPTTDLLAFAGFGYEF